MNPDIIFHVRALRTHHNRLQELKDALAAKMIGDLEKGNLVSWRDYPEREGIDAAEGLLDRTRRDLVQVLAKEPTYLLSLCDLIESAAKSRPLDVTHGIPAP